MEINQVRLEAELSKLRADASAQAQRAAHAEGVANMLYQQRTATPHHHYTYVHSQQPQPPPTVPPIAVPVGPSAAEVEAQIRKERQRGQRLHEELSKRLTSVQQQMAEQQVDAQRARASEQAGWQARQAFEVRAGRAEALAQQAAMPKDNTKGGSTEG